MSDEELENLITRMQKPLVRQEQRRGSYSDRMEEQRSSSGEEMDLVPPNRDLMHELEMNRQEQERLEANLSELTYQAEQMGQSFTGEVAAQMDQLYRETQFQWQQRKDQQIALENQLAAQQFSVHQQILAQQQMATQQQMLTSQSAIQQQHALRQQQGIEKKQAFFEEERIRKQAEHDASVQQLAIASANKQQDAIAKRAPGQAPAVNQTPPVNQEMALVRRSSKGQQASVAPSARTQRSRQSQKALKNDNIPAPLVAPIPSSPAPGVATIPSIPPVGKHTYTISPLLASARSKYYDYYALRKGMWLKLTRPYQSKLPSVPVSQVPHYERIHQDEPVILAIRKEHGSYPKLIPADAPSESSSYDVVALLLPPGTVVGSGGDDTRSVSLPFDDAILLVPNTKTEIPSRGFYFNWVRWITAGAKEAAYWMDEYYREKKGLLLALPETPDAVVRYQPPVAYDTVPDDAWRNIPKLKELGRDESLLALFYCMTGLQRDMYLPSLRAYYEDHMGEFAELHTQDEFYLLVYMLVGTLSDQVLFAIYRYIAYHADVEDYENDYNEAMRSEFSEGQTLLHCFARVVVSFKLLERLREMKTDEYYVVPFYFIDSFLIDRTPNDEFSQRHPVLFNLVHEMPLRIPLTPRRDIAKEFLKRLLVAAKVANELKDRYLLDVIEAMIQYTRAEHTNLYFEVNGSLVESVRPNADDAVDEVNSILDSVAHCKVGELFYYDFVYVYENILPWVAQEKIKEIAWEVVASEGKATNDPNSIKNYLRVNLVDPKYDGVLAGAQLENGADAHWVRRDKVSRRVYVPKAVQDFISGGNSTVPWTIDSDDYCAELLSGLKQAISSKGSPPWEEIRSLLLLLVRNHLPVFLVDSMPTVVAPPQILPPSTVVVHTPSISQPTIVAGVPRRRSSAPLARVVTTTGAGEDDKQSKRTQGTEKKHEKRRYNPDPPDPDDSDFDDSNYSDDPDKDPNPVKREVGEDDGEFSKSVMKKFESMLGTDLLEDALFTIQIAHPNRPTFPYFVAELYTKGRIGLQVLYRAISGCGDDMDKLVALMKRLCNIIRVHPRRLVVLTPNVVPSVRSARRMQPLGLRLSVEGYLGVAHPNLVPLFHAITDKIPETPKSTRNWRAFSSESRSRVIIFRGRLSETSSDNFRNLERLACRFNLSLRCLFRLTFGRYWRRWRPLQ